MALDLSGWANNTIAENERTFRSDDQDLETGEALRTCIERHIILYRSWRLTELPPNNGNVGWKATKIVPFYREVYVWMGLDEHELNRENRYVLFCLRGMSQYPPWARSRASSPIACSHGRLQGDPSGLFKPPVDLDLGCSAILPGQLVAAVVA